MFLFHLVIDSFTKNAMYTCVQVCSLHPVHQVGQKNLASLEKIQICEAILRSHATTRAFQEGSIVTTVVSKICLGSQQDLSLS